MKWNDEYWPLLIQLYKKKPEGVKPLYSRSIVDTALELHITPQELRKKMMELRNPNSLHLQHLVEEFSSTKKLNKAVNIIKQKEGYGTGGEYYEGVEVNESWELDFRPLECEPRLTPAHIILILDLYFQLTPSTMVSDTEEIQDLAKMLHVPLSLVVHVMQTMQYCDPYLNLMDSNDDPLINICNNIWQRYGNDDTEKLSAFASQLKEYFK